MKIYLTAALTAILFLSDPAHARRKRALEIVTIVSTITVVPLPVSTSDGVSFQGLAVESEAVQPTGHRPKGHFGSGKGGHAWPTGTGFNDSRQTGKYINETVSSTSSARPTVLSVGAYANVTSSIPFFTLQTTASLPFLNATSLGSSTSAATTMTISISSNSSFNFSSLLPTLSTSDIPSSISSLLLSSLLPTTTATNTPSSNSSILSSSLTTTATSNLTPSVSSSVETSSKAAQSTSELTPIIPSTTSSTSSISTSTAIPFLRGVNLGGWLVLEKWMDGDLFSGDFSSAVDQYSFDQISGAEAALQEHWSTFFVESDISDLADAGINALRIPIGYWAYDNTNTPYISGADEYLEKAIGWARNYGMKVWVDCHGSPGSQNGFDNSGHAGVNEWQTDVNLALSTNVLQTMAKKYGSTEYADVVVGLEMTNEPISYGNNLFSTTKSWTEEAYTAVKAEVENKDMVVVMHDAFEGPLAWESVAETLLTDIVDLLTGQTKTFGIDTHIYGLYTDAEDDMTQAQHITEVCGKADNLKIANAIMPTYVGEWSPVTNICVNPDGTTTAGTSCSISGCQCQSAAFDDWNDGMIEAVRKYVEAQMDVWESSTSGYFMWAAKGPGGWGFLNGIEKGIIPNPVTDRKYGSQCGGSSRREVRGKMGRIGEAW